MFFQFAISYTCVKFIHCESKVLATEWLVAEELMHSRIMRFDLIVEVSICSKLYIGRDA